jgi:hypothetical protein
MGGSIIPISDSHPGIDNLISDQEYEPRCEPGTFSPAAMIGVQALSRTTCFLGPISGGSVYLWMKSARSDFWREFNGPNFTPNRFRLGKEIDPSAPPIALNQKTFHLLSVNGF